MTRAAPTLDTRFPRLAHAVLALSTLVAATAGCAGGAPSPTTTSGRSESPVSSTVSAAVPSDLASPPADLVVGGDRPVTVHVPLSYDPNQPAPLLILLHGYGGSGDLIDGYFHMGPAADAAGFVYVHPDGTPDKDGNHFWNATDACCNFHGAEVDDVAYLTDVISEIEAEVAIDPKRIAVVGHSNGGFMSYRMACERADRVAAIVSLAGGTYADPTDCAPSEPVSVAQIHGTLDDTIVWEGGRINGVPYPGPETTSETWATYDGCDATAATLPEKLDVDADGADGTEPAETTVTEWSGCDAGADVQLWTIPDGSHAPSISMAFPDAVLDFLTEHSKP